MSERRSLFESKRFSGVARENLRNQGYELVTLTGKTISDYINDEKPIRSNIEPFWGTEADTVDILNMPSMSSEAALNPNSLFISGSNNKNLREQLKVFENFREGIRKKIKDVDVVIGEAPDYVDLVFSYLSLKGVKLFGEEHDFNYATTLTPAFDDASYRVGMYSDSLHLYSFDKNIGGFQIFVAPLIIPNK